MDDKGIIFTTDLLLALIIVTMAIGLSLSQFEQLNYGIQHFTVRQGLDKTVNDAADYMIKNPGNPVNWDFQDTPPSNTLPGLTFINDNGYPEIHYLDGNKIQKLNNNKGLLVNLVNPGGSLSNTNFHLTLNLINPDGSQGSNLLDISSNLNTLSTANEVAVANRTVMVNYYIKLFSLLGVLHIPGNKAAVGEWYYGGTGQPNTLYVGPGNTTGSASSFTPTPGDSYYIIITQGGPGTAKPQYAITGGNEVVNGTYHDSSVDQHDDPNRLTNLDPNTLSLHNPSYQWVNFPNNPSLGTKIDITPYVNYMITYLQSKGEPPYMKLWIQRSGNPHKSLSFDVIEFKPGQQGAINSPAKLVLTIW